MSRLRLFALLMLLGWLAVLWAAEAGAAEPPDPASRVAPAATATATPLTPAAGRLHPALRRALAESEPDAYHPIIIEWRAADPLWAEIMLAPDRLARRQQVIAALQAGAERRSAPLRAALASATETGAARGVRAFWIAPVIALEARPDLIATLAERDDVAQVRLNAPILLEDPQFASAAAPGNSAETAWNLAMVRADLAGAALGLDGAGIVVANLDTGVDWQHPALLTRYRGYRAHGQAVHRGNWHVSTDEPYLYPGDGYGHGTHTMGTMVGDDGAGHRVGVAPGARWIAVKIFTNEGYTLESWIHDAFQWIIAPEGDPSLAPDVVNNSWGSDASGDLRFRQDVSALRAAGILPVFSAGNEGPGQGTVNSPGSFGEVLAIGALDEYEVLAAFSARGPNPWGGIKPDLVAPGVQVVSTFPGGGWATATGTSMAAPHVAGLAALLLQAQPGLPVDQVEALLRETARPLGQDVPNNDTGWGLVDAYAAGLRVTAHGEISGRIARADGAGIPAATIIATAHDDARTAITAMTDASGAFTVALRAGLYDLIAHAFGFEAGGANGVRVIESGRIPVTMTLPALPAGSVFGRVTDSATGAPLSATITVDDAPLSLRTDPTTGLYSLALPAGAWRLQITAPAHRIAHVPVTITVGAGQSIDVPLRPGPTILLVDSGRWYYESRSAYFADALAALDYPFTAWPIIDPLGNDGLPGQRPRLKTLLAHDVVVWSAPLDSPGLVGADADLSAYLRTGGRLLVSGQDVAYLDGGGSLFDAPSRYFASDMGLAFAGEDELSVLAGTPSGPLAGITLTVNTPDSAANQDHPDNASIRFPTLSRAAMDWPDSAIGGAVAGACQPYRAAWLGVGLEGVGPRAHRIAALDRLLNWFAAPPQPYGLLAVSEAKPLIGPAGSTVTATIQLNATGALSDTIDLHIVGDRWPLTVKLPTGGAASPSFPMSSCSGITLTASIAIPADAPPDVRAAYTLTFRSHGDPAVVQTVSLAVKTPAPILLVDDQRWYDHAVSYTTTLDALALSYDIYDTLDGGNSPPTDTLMSYALVVWTTGYDWYSPLGPQDEKRLSAYLDHGGRLLLTGQDILDVIGVDAFVRDRLGVMGASLTVTTTEVLGLPGSPLGSDLGPWRLTYPFHNWSDAVVPRPGAFGTFQDERLFTVGAANGTAAWRTAFFPFPLEALDDDARAALVGRTLLWLSPLGDSRLEAPAFAPAGGRIPVTLTLGLAADAPRAGLRARLPLPPGASLAEGSVRGPWRYEAAEAALTWSGSLAPDATLVLGADLALAAGLPAGDRLPLRAYLYAGNGLTITADAPIAIDVPWLTLVEQASPRQTSPGGTVQYTLTVQNIGLVGTTVRLTDTLPAEIRTIDGSAWASRGVVTPGKTRILWSDALEPGGQAQIGFTGIISMTHRGGRLADRTEVMDERGRRALAWAVVSVPEWQYVPLVLR
jgi:uncharacterized repeat protein (TIGR01451 family)